MEGSTRTIDLFNLDERLENRMGHIDNNMERIVKIIQNLEKFFSKGDDVAYVTQEDRYSDHVYLPFINKNDPRGFDSNNGSNQGWSLRGIQLSKINMRKFDTKDHITWIS